MLEVIQIITTDLMLNRDSLWGRLQSWGIQNAEDKSCVLDAFEKELSSLANALLVSICRRKGLINFTPAQTQMAAEVFEKMEDENDPMSSAGPD